MAIALPTTKTGDRKKRQPRNWAMGVLRLFHLYKKTKMKNHNENDFNCRHCRHYHPEGRRGGCCQQFNATVQGDWDACSLLSHPFNTPKDLDNLGDIIWLEKSLVLRYGQDRISS